MKHYVFSFHKIGQNLTDIQREACVQKTILYDSCMYVPNKIQIPRECKICEFVKSL